MLIFNNLLQPTSLFSRLRQCATLEADTDSKLKILIDTPLSELDILCNLLKGELLHTFNNLYSLVHICASNIYYF